MKFNTRMKIIYQNHWPPNGGKIYLNIDFSFSSPDRDRMNGCFETKNGRIFIWHNGIRECVFMTMFRVDTLPYLGAGEFYLEYGTFDVHINSPSDHVVVCSGSYSIQKTCILKHNSNDWNKQHQVTKLVLSAANEINDQTQSKVKTD